jgi:hypothetical protein
LARDDPNRGGGDQYPRKPTPEEIAAMATLCSFTIWAAEDNAMYGARRAQEAVEAVCVITGLTPAQVRKIAMPSE